MLDAPLNFEIAWRMRIGDVSRADRSIIANHVSAIIAAVAAAAAAAGSAVTTQHNIIVAFAIFGLFTTTKYYLLHGR